jgi:hypothetical protein
MADEHSPYRETIIKWIADSIAGVIPGWPPLDQLSEEQRVMVESMADTWEQIAKAYGLPLECFTWDVERRVAW